MGGRTGAVVTGLTSPLTFLGAPVRGQAGSCLTVLGALRTGRVPHGCVLSSEDADTGLPWIFLPSSRLAGLGWAGA